MKKLKEELKKKEFSKVYLFFGPEDYLKKVYLERLKRLRITPDEELMNLQIIEGKSVSAEVIEQSVMTPPFLGSFRFTIVKGSGLFKSGKKGEASEAADLPSSNDIIDIIDHIPDDACLVFVEDEIDKRSKLYKKIQKDGRAVEFTPLSEADTIKWIAAEFAKRKIKIDKATALYFLRYVNGDMEAVQIEIEKLSSYLGDRQQVEKADIDKVCVKSFQTKIFDLVESMGKKDADRAIEIYRNMIMTKEPPMRIFIMVVRQIRMIFQSKNLEKQGYSSAEIAQKLNLHEFAVKEALREARNFSSEEIKNAMEDCLETDRKIKTGLMNDELAVELLIIKYGTQGES
ncbi:MAG: DNA polymerase III subunit delta [Firmicutes bacterium]|nr:DNA polymerase III subunit delta [Bacillota bacterium]